MLNKNMYNKNVHLKIHFEKLISDEHFKKNFAFKPNRWNKFDKK